ncbi:PAS domain S-box protein [Maribrevibacterium harenarium]|nr:PAS domain S-box protein [Maribrevibacterium harenarium]
MASALIAHFLVGNRVDQIGSDARHIMELKAENLRDQIAQDINILMSLRSEVQYLSHTELSEFSPHQWAHHHVFRSVLTRNWHVYQLRLISEGGQEISRIDKHRSTGEIIETAAVDLINVNYRPYMDEMRRLNDGQVYLSTIDLNIERGQVEQPLRPTFRLATRLPLMYHGEKVYLIVNVEAEEVLKMVKLGFAAMPIELYLANNVGDWSYSEHPEQAWASQLQHQEGLASSHPEMFRLVQNNDMGEYLDRGDYWYWQRLIITHPEMGVFGVYGAYNFATILVEVPEETVWALRKNYFSWAFAWMLATILILGGGTYELTRRQRRNRHRFEEERFRNIFSSLSTGIVVVNREARIVMTNGAARDMFGYTEGELESQYIEVLVPKDVRTHHRS